MNYTSKTVASSRFMRAIRHEPVDCTPLWIMRQAGRYLPEYRAIRQQAGSFMALCKTPELARTVTLQPLARFPLDAAIIFSDILTIPDACGLGLSFKEGEGPVFERPLRTEKEIKNLPIPDPETELRYVLDTVRMVAHDLDAKVPLIGFCGSPWTLAAYMIEGQGSKQGGFPFAFKMLNTDPESLHILLDKLATAVALHLNAQIKAGANAVMLFDTWGGLLNTATYQTFSLHYCQKIFDQLIKEHQGERIPSILFTKNGGQWLNLMAKTGCDALGVDHQVSLKAARSQLNDKVALQGNLNPDILMQSPEKIREAVASILADYGPGSGHIFNLGHGITPSVPVDHVAALVEAVHTLSRPYHL